MSDSVNAFVGLGSNMGDRLAMLRRAVTLLGDREGILLDCKSGVAGLFETEPVGGPGGQLRFLNSAFRVRTTLEPTQLMDALLEIEVTLGRKRGIPGESRNIDLDLLLYDQSVCNTVSLTLPHPRLHERRFVLEPLTEIAADFVHPTIRRTVSEITVELRSKSSQEVVRIMGREWLLR